MDRDGVYYISSVHYLLAQQPPDRWKGSAVGHKRSRAKLYSTIQAGFSVHKHCLGSEMVGNGVDLVHFCVLFERQHVLTYK